MVKWSIKIGKKTITVCDSTSKCDAYEVCTRALEYLRDQKIDYVIGPVIEVRKGAELIFCPADVILANAGRYKEAAHLQSLIEQAKKAKKS